MHSWEKHCPYSIEIAAFFVCLLDLLYEFFLPEETTCPRWTMNGRDWMWRIVVLL